MILRAAFAFKNQIFGTGLTQTGLAGVGVVIGVYWCPSLMLICYQAVEYFQDFVGFFPLLSLFICPIKSYSNAEDDKAKILQDNQNKSGIYM
jgi:hypothetical protein